MTVTESPNECIAVLDTQPSVLYVRYPNGQEHCFDMPSGKATLGAGAGCALPIRFPGVGPLHCVLFPTPTGWRVRRWSGDTLLNGGLFTEAAIEVGDRLKLGPVEVEFAGDEPIAEHKLETTEPVLDDSVCEVPEQAPEEATNEKSTRNDVADFLPVVCESHNLIEPQIPSLQIVELTERVEETFRQLAERLADDQHLQQDVSELRQQLEDIRHELARAEQLHIATRESVVELDRQITLFRNSLADLKPSRPKGLGLGRRVWPVGLRRRLALHELTHSNAIVMPRHAEGFVVEPETESAAFQSEVKESEFTPTAEAIETPQLDWLNQIRESVVEVSEPSEVDGDGPSEALFSAPEEDKEPFQEPESFLNRFQHLLHEDNHSPNESFPSARVNEPAIQPSQPEPVVEEQSASAISDDDSIEGYMARLLQRVRGEATSSPVVPVTTANPTNAPATVKSAAAPEAPVPPKVELVGDLQEIKSAPAPERSRDMAALRNLANNSARHAICDAQIRQRKEHAITKVVVSLLAIICGLFVMHLSPSYTSPEFIGGLVPMFAGALWGTRTIVMLLKAIRDGAFLDDEDEKQNQIALPVSADEL